MQQIGWPGYMEYLFSTKTAQSQTRGPLLPPPTTSEPTSREATAHSTCASELSPPTVPTVQPTLILLDLLQQTHTHAHITLLLLNASNGSRTLTAYERARPLHDSSRNHPAARPRMASNE